MYRSTRTLSSDSPPPSFNSATATYDEDHNEDHNEISTISTEKRRSTLVSIEDNKSVFSESVSYHDGEKRNKFVVDAYELLKTSDIMFVLKPILISLKILGLWPKYSEKFFKRLNIQSGFIVFYLHVYTFHLAINWLFSFHRNLGFYPFLHNASLLVRTGATAATIDLFFHEYFNIIHSLTQIDGFPPLFLKTNLRSIRFYITLITLGSWFYVVSQLCFSAWSVSTMDIQQFMNWYFYGFKVEHMNMAFMRVLMASVWTIYIMITLSAEVFLKTFYVASCLILGRCARSYNEMVLDLDMQETISGDDIHKINLLHTKLCDLVIGINRNFTIKAFLWISTIFLNICTKIGSIFVGTNASETSAAFMDITNYFLMFIVISLVAADVSHQCEILLPIAHRLASKADMSEMSVLYQAKLMIAKMSSPVAKLSGWDCFTIDRSFILTVIGTILTYSVVLMQMSKGVSEERNLARLKPVLMDNSSWSDLNRGVYSTISYTTTDNFITDIINTTYF